ncbi:MAG: dUTP diphosphatase [Ignavibacteriaceae bacterium]|nr:dUTP diphosphatase [Ignavibacteriaceae bacterium]
MENIKIKIKRINEEYYDIPLPEYATEGSAGMDIRAAIKDSSIIKMGEYFMVPTNLSVQIPPGFEIQVRPRSGLAAKYGIGILNSPGTIDSDYRGEIKIILFNFGKSDYTIQRGDRIAQLIISKVYIADLNELNALNDSKRGIGGFGHTGEK